MIRFVFALLVLVTLFLGVGAELARAAAAVGGHTGLVGAAGRACCPCDDGDGHETSGGCCADDLGACGCAAASVAFEPQPDPPAPASAPRPVGPDLAGEPSTLSCRAATPPPTPPPIG